MGNSGLLKYMRKCAREGGKGRNWTDTVLVETAAEVC